MANAILTLNAGSSSIKFALFAVGSSGLQRELAGQIESISTSPHLTVHDAGGKHVAESRWLAEEPDGYATCLHRLLEWIEQHLGQHRLLAAGHRVVHGGKQFVQPVLLNAPVIASLKSLSPLAPLHQPHNIEAIEALAKLRPQLAQAACFDTAFHHDHDAVVDRFGLPRQWEAAGVKRYGFHGLSYEYIAAALRESAPALVKERVIVAHLGNGASLCAMRNGKSVDSTMGFTALDGLVMGTRCGTLDAGVVLYLMQQHGLTADAVQDLLYHRSGLLGVSGISSDMRALLASDDFHAHEAIDLFVFRIVREIGALMMSLGGLNGLVFTGGIGENAAAVRQRVCERLTWLGVRVDALANMNNAACISADDSAIEVRVIAADEECMIARHTFDLIN